MPWARGVFRTCALVLFFVCLSGVCVCRVRVTPGAPEWSAVNKLCGFRTTVCAQTDLPPVTQKRCSIPCWKALRSLRGRINVCGRMHVCGVLCERYATPTQTHAQHEREQYGRERGVTLQNAGPQKVKRMQQHNGRHIWDTGCEWWVDVTWQVHEFFGFMGVWGERRNRRNTSNISSKGQQLLKQHFPGGSCGRRGVANQMWSPLGCSGAL